MGRKIDAFTLIELLVVVAIIAVLIAILLPALQSARDEGHKIICLSHMRQLGMGVRYYADDYNGNFPYPRDGETKWFNAVNVYLKNRNLFQCPSRKGRGEELLKVPPSGYPNWSLNVGFNHWFLYDYTQYPFNLYLNFWKKGFRDIARPDETMLIADGDYWLLNEDWSGLYVGNLTDGQRHAKGKGYGLNQLFADLHSETATDFIPTRWDPHGYTYWWGMDYEHEQYK